MLVKYLNFCLEKIKNFLLKEDLLLNKKTKIYKNTNNFIFLGTDKYNKKNKYRENKRKLKYKKYLYETNRINLNSYLCSYINYR